MLTCGVSELDGSSQGALAKEAIRGGRPSICNIPELMEKCRFFRPCTQGLFVLL